MNSTRPVLNEKPYFLGLDLGTSSIGWAIIDADSSEVRSSGVRAYDAGLDELEKDGRGKSRNADRRANRLIRRGLDRRARRLAKLAGALQRAGLLPAGRMVDSVKRHELLTKLDETLDSPYQLRARALDGPLTPLELGRALFHLGQRRGFLSNRKSAVKKDEKPGEVKKSINDLSSHISENGKRTLGEYFASLDPHQLRIRGRYTSRKMYEDEFIAIWDSQKSHHSEALSDRNRRKIYNAIFKQRPLKSVRNLVGECELEPTKKRAAWSNPEAQRFRYLEKVNNLRIEGGPRDGQPLTESERTQLNIRLERGGDISFAELRKLLGQGRNSKYNLERGGEKKITGNRTISGLIETLGEESWDALSPDDQKNLIEDIRSISSDQALKKRVMKRWGFSEETAVQVAELSVEPGYCNFSVSALRKLLPRLEKGEATQTAIKELYPARFGREGVSADSLPPLDKSGLTVMRNPIVVRTLSETRAVVNAILARHGKPEKIRIELGRDLRQNADQRNEAVKRMRGNENFRDDAKARLLKETGIAEPKGDDILRVRLADECGWHCPYTGEGFGWTDLISQHTRVDIEHIIPFERSLDNSYLNKTLCISEENRNVKKGKTPYEAYVHSAEWEKIVQRVENFAGDAAKIKIRRFQLTPEEVELEIAGFTSRQLNDTRWAAKWAKKYLGLLYGSVTQDGIDIHGERRVQATSGPVTAYLRSEWGLNGILRDGNIKTREDHRHHAVDAIVIALTDEAAVKQLSAAAGRATSERRRLFGSVTPPSTDLLASARESVLKIVTSHRVSRRVRGALHEMTFYAQTRTDEDGLEYRPKRIPLEKLTDKNVELIIDPVVKKAIQNKLATLSGGFKAFAHPENHPALVQPNGAVIPIHKVRVKEKFTAFPVGQGHRQRHVTPDRNHHMEIFAVLDESGKVKKWDASVVSIFDAYQRKKAGSPIVNTDHGPKTKHLFTLSGNEVIELDTKNAGRQLFVVRTVPQSKQIRFVPINDARVLKEISKIDMTAMPGSLLERNCQKKTVSPLCEVRDSEMKALSELLET